MIVGLPSTSWARCYSGSLQDLESGASAASTLVRVTETTTETLRLTATVHPVTVTTRDYSSTHFLWAARHFASLAAQIERAPRGAFDIELRAFVLASVQMSVGFLEASVNEVFQDAVDGHEPYLEHLPPEAVRRMAQVWLPPYNGERSQALDKYQILLDCCDAARLDPGVMPFQAAQRVVRVRNEIAHFRPHDVSYGPQATPEKEIQRLARELCASDVTEFVEAVTNLAWTVFGTIGIDANAMRHEAQGGIGNPPGELHRPLGPA